MEISIRKGTEGEKQLTKAAYNETPVTVGTPDFKISALVVGLVELEDSISYTLETLYPNTVLTNRGKKVRP
jgi:hypothetical protein